MKRAISSPSSLDIWKPKDSKSKDNTNSNLVKKARFDSNRTMTENDEKDISVSTELEREKERNQTLQNEIVSMRKQLENLTEQISRLTSTINSMQHEKDVIKSNGISFNSDESEMSVDSDGTNIKNQTEEKNKKETENVIQSTSTESNASLKEIMKEQVREKKNERESDDESITEALTNTIQEQTAKTNTMKRTNKVPPIDVWCEERAEMQRATTR